MSKYALHSLLALPCEEHPNESLILSTSLIPSLATQCILWLKQCECRWHDPLLGTSFKKHHVPQHLCGSFCHSIKSVWEACSFILGPRAKSKAHHGLYDINKKSLLLWAITVMRLFWQYKLAAVDWWNIILTNNPQISRLKKERLFFTESQCPSDSAGEPCSVESDFRDPAGRGCTFFSCYHLKVKL